MLSGSVMKEEIQKIVVSSTGNLICLHDSNMKNNMQSVLATVGVMCFNRLKYNVFVHENTEYMCPPFQDTVLPCEWESKLL